MTLQVHDNIQHRVTQFFTAITSNPVFEEASNMGILSVPLAEDWDTREFQTHIVPVWTRQRYNYFLVFHLQLSGICAFPIDYPTVPKGQGRIRLIFHGRNNEAEVHSLLNALAEFAREMVAIEKAGENAQNKVPKAAQQVYALMAQA